MLKKRVEEAEYQKRVLEENYKSSSQGERQELLEKAALAEVRANDALGQIAIKDDEIATLKKEIDNLRERVQEAYTEKDKLANEMDQKLQEAQVEGESGKSISEEYAKELTQANDTIQKLEGTVKAIEAELNDRIKDSQENEAALQKQIQELKEQRLSQDGSTKELEEQKNEYENLLKEKEQQRQKQKNEWAEVSFYDSNDLTKTTIRYTET